MARKFKMTPTLAQFKAGITKAADNLRRHGLLDAPGTFGIYAPKKTGFAHKHNRSASRFNMGTFSHRPKNRERTPSLNLLEEFSAPEDL